MATTPMVRPSPNPPNPETEALDLMRTPAVILHHPGYGLDSMLLTLPAMDGTATAPGLHQRTVLTAGAIIADNAFDRVYLTRDREGSERVDAIVPPDGLVEPGEYYLQVDGYDLYTRAVSSMPPPTAPLQRSSNTATQTQTSNPNQHILSPTASTPDLAERKLPYPIIPSFSDWQFPHNRLPAEWTQSRVAPPPIPMPSSHRSMLTRRCWITGYHMGLNECHMVPNNQDVWCVANKMRQYTTGTDAVTRDAANIALLRADLHQVLDGHKFALVPKPSGLSETTFAFAAHVLKSDDESREFASLYHNSALAQAGVDRLSPEFLFARFAWAIFSQLQTFLHSSIIPHRLAIMVRENNDRYRAVESMDGQEWSKHLASQGITRSGSKTRKRASSQITQETDQDADDDAYLERWERRSQSLNSTRSTRSSSSVHQLEDELDPEMRQIRRNTDFYDKVGRFSRGDIEQEQLDRNTRWYDEVGRFSRGDMEQEQLDRNTRWYDEVGWFSRGEAEHEQLEERSKLAGADHASDSADEEPPRGRRLELGSSPPGSDGVPPLSRSFTTHGSNRSISPTVHSPNGDEAGPGLPIASASPDDKVVKAANGPVPDQDASVDEHMPP